jgi:hypothetical protein
MKDLTPLESQLLITLSFLEPMSLEYILIDLSKEFLLAHHDLTTQNLEESLTALVALKKLRKISPKKNEAETQIKWIRIFPKKSLWSKVQRILKL